MTERFRFFVFSSRDPRLGDFRTPFVEALRQQYQNVSYKDRSTLQHVGSGQDGDVAAAAPAIFLAAPAG